ncbi:MAG: hypothetical protein ACREM2_06180 [Vulcanimicrobiaceae bacterium]
MAADVVDEAVGAFAVGAFGVDVESRLGLVGEDEKPAAVNADPYAVEEFERRVTRQRQRDRVQIGATAK